MFSARKAQAAEKDFLRSLARNHPICTQTVNNWIELGQILARIRKTMVSCLLNCALRISMC